MTEKETAQIVGLVVEFYPSFMTGRNLKSAVTAWHMVLQDEPYELVESALMTFVSTDTKGFAPAVGMLKQIISDAKADNDMTPVAAWGYISKALRNSLYGYREEFAKLPPDIQATVGCAEQLRDWAMLEESEVMTVVSSNFQRSFKTTQERQREQAKIPASVKERLNALVGQIGRLPQGVQNLPEADTGD